MMRDEARELRPSQEPGDHAVAVMGHALRGIERGHVEAVGRGGAVYAIGAEHRHGDEARLRHVRCDPLQRCGGINNRENERRTPGREVCGVWAAKVRPARTVISLESETFAAHVSNFDE